MNYFSKFPIITYEFSKTDEKLSYLLLDITRNVRFRKKLLQEITLYDEYDIIDGETPEIISNKVYGSPFYHWVVMLANDRYDWVKDYPMTDSELDAYIIEKYGSIEQAIETTKHYVDSNGRVVYFDPTKLNFSYMDPITGTMTKLNYETNTGGLPSRVSCYDYEIQVNESKRRLKIISPKLINTIMNNFRDLM